MANKLLQDLVDAIKSLRHVPNLIKDAAKGVGKGFGSAFGAVGKGFSGAGAQLSNFMGALQVEMNTHRTPGKNIASHELKGAEGELAKVRSMRALAGFQTRAAEREEARLQHKLTTAKQVGGVFRIKKAEEELAVGKAKAERFRIRENQILPAQEYEAAQKVRDKKKEYDEAKKEEDFQNSLGGKIGRLGKVAQKRGFGGLGETLGNISEQSRAMGGNPAFAVMDAATQGVDKFSDVMKQLHGANTPQGGPKGTELYGDRIEKNFSEAFKGVGKFGEMLGPFGAPIKGLAKLGEVTFGAIDKIKVWSEQLHQSNMRFAEFSGSMAQVQAEQQIRDIHYSMERGEARAAGARRLAESASARRQAMAGVEDAYAEIQNNQAVASNQILQNLPNILAQAMTGGILRLPTPALMGTGSLNTQGGLNALGSMGWSSTHLRPDGL